MEKNIEIDFYGMGMRKVNDIYEETDKIANEIEKVYGLDSRLQYECGVSIAMGKKSVGKLSNMFDQDIIHIVNNIIFINLLISYFFKKFISFLMLTNITMMIITESSF